MEAAARDPLLTAEEFWDVCAHLDVDAELVDGRVRTMAPTGPEHGRVDRKLVIPLGSFVEQHGLGEVFLSTDFILRRNPDVTRGPDQAFVSARRMAENPPPERGFWELVPDLVVEIVSPNDTAVEVNEKVGDYLAAGVRLTWVVHPRQRQVHVYYPCGDARILFSDGALDGEDVIPGFRLPLRDFLG